MQIEKRTGFWYKLLVRLKLAESTYELNEAVRIYQNHRRHFSIDSDARDRRYSAINQTTITTMASTSEEQRSRVFSEFVKLQQKRYSLDILNNSLENEDIRPDNTRSKRIKRLNFFGETLEDFDFNDEIENGEISNEDSKNQTG